MSGDSGLRRRKPEEGGAAATSKKGKSKKQGGFWHRFSQQQLPAWQPVLTPKGVVCIFWVLFFVLASLGILIYTAASSAVSIEFQYGVNTDANTDDISIKQKDGTEFAKVIDGTTT